MFNFLKDQIKQLQKGGWPILIRKTAMVPSLILAIPAVLIIRAVRPWLIIRFRRFHSYRIGHFAGNTEIYLCEREAGINVPRQRFVDIFYCNWFVCNSQLEKMWNRRLRVWPATIAAPIGWLDLWLSGKDIRKVRWPATQDRDVHNVLAHSPLHLSFLSQEEHQGRESLKAMGIPEGKPFVCFIARDSAYMKTTFPDRDWSYQAHTHRSSNIRNYIPAIERLTDRGYYAVRMGAVVQEALNLSNPQIIDYATNGHRTDFMDIYLSAKCQFFISSSTGLDSVPAIFRRPIMIVDYAPLEYISTWFPYNLTIFKKHWLRDERRFMTVREILESGVGRWRSTEKFKQRGIELIENTPEEIAALAIEMDERLRGTWQTSEDDEELQRRFWSLYKSSELHGQIVSRIGAEFLRQNRELLD